MILIIAEKALAGIDIAAALGATGKGDGFIKGKGIVVTWAEGHLVGLKEPEEYNPSYKIWELEQLPILLPRENYLKVIQRKEFQTIERLMKQPDVEEIVNAGDPGREGELIQRWIYQMAGNQKKVTRMWYHSLTVPEIQRSFQNRADSRLYDHLFSAGEARAKYDMMAGINYSRALTLTKASGLTLTYGRCQTPLLQRIVERDLERKEFVPEEYWTIKAQFVSEGVDYLASMVEKEGKHYRLVHFQSEKEAQECANGLPKEAEVIKEGAKEVIQKPPYLFNLNRLQQYMSVKFNYSAAETLEIAQHLYASRKILSYPRTDSSVLSTSLYPTIMKNLFQMDFAPFREHITELRETNRLMIPKYIFDDSKVGEHHALIPVLNDRVSSIYQTLTQKEKNVYQAVAKSFIASFYPAYIYESTAVLQFCGKHLFLSRGIRQKQEGWKQVFRGEKKQEKEGQEKHTIPEVKTGDWVKREEAVTEKAVTHPKDCYTEASLLELMEAWKIGTSATQAALISDLLRSRGKNKEAYAKKLGNHFVSTEFGSQFISIVPEHLKSLERVSEIEQQIKKIEDGSLDGNTFMNTYLLEMENTIRFLKEEDTSQRLLSEDDYLCPVCKINHLIKYDWGYGCAGYKQHPCGFTLSNPLYGRRLSKDEISVLLKEGKTPMLKGFKYKNGTVYEGSVTIKEGKAEVIKKYNPYEKKATISKYF